MISSVQCVSFVVVVVALKAYRANRLQIIQWMLGWNSDWVLSVGMKCLMAISDIKIKHEKKVHRINLYLDYHFYLFQAYSAKPSTNTVHAQTKKEKKRKKKGMSLPQLTLLPSSIKGFAAAPCLICRRGAGCAVGAPAAEASPWLRTHGPASAL